MFIYLFILLARNMKKFVQMVKKVQIKNNFARTFVLHKCCIKKCTVNKMVFLTCCTANLDFVFHGCRLVEGFVAVRRFRQAEDVLVGDCVGLQHVGF